MRSKPELMEIPVADLTMSCVREIYDTNPEPMDGMLESFGLLSPLIVRVTRIGYEVVDGERRLLAAERLGIKTLTCVVYRNYSDADVWRMRFFAAGANHDRMRAEEARKRARQLKDA